MRKPHWRKKQQYFFLLILFLNLDFNTFFSQKFGAYNNFVKKKNDTPAAKSPTLCIAFLKHPHRFKLNPLPTSPLLSAVDMLQASTRLVIFVRKLRLVPGDLLIVKSRKGAFHF